MYQYHYLNQISDKGTALWTEEYKKTDDVAQAQAIVVRRDRKSTRLNSSH